MSASRREELWYILANIREIGPITTEKLLDYARDIEDLCAMTDEDMEKSGILDRKMLKAWHEKRMCDTEVLNRFEAEKSRGVHFVSIEHEDYPAKLKNISGHPYGIFYLGRNVNSYDKTAAIIGSRGCTPYGRDLAGELGRQLAAIGVTVVSGMALGIDASGQWGAINGGGSSVGVLGSGVDVCYPRDNYALYEELCGHNTIISEQPCGMPGLPQNFVLRNRIISGLSDCVIVVEARKKSGTQITVSYALDQGRDIFCIPGRLTDPLSRGCNEMISQGARILYDFSELAEYFHSEDMRIDVTMVAELTPMEKMVYEHLTDDVKHVEDIMRETGLPVTDLCMLLLNLEIKGVAHEQIKNYYRRVIRL